MAALFSRIRVLTVTSLVFFLVVVMTTEALALHTSGRGGIRSPLLAAPRLSVCFADAVTGKPHPAEEDARRTVENIGDVRVDELHEKREFVMVLLVDRKSKYMLLQVPNKLGWGYHFGCAVPSPSDDIPKDNHSKLWEAALLEAREQTKPLVIDQEKPMRPAGLMLFNFRNSDGHSPMRIRIVEANVDAVTTTVGKHYGYDGVPYDDMWADDVYWLPTLLAKPGTYAEGHFVFEGPPGKTSNLIEYSCKFYDEEGRELTMGKDDET